MQLQELAKKLESLGLTDKQARVYVSNSFLGPTSVQKISRQSGVNRATTYVILEELKDLGLVSQSTQKNKTVFIAEEPVSLGRLLDKQEQVIKVKKDELLRVLPALRHITHGEAKDAPVVRFYQGIEAAKSMRAELRRGSRPGDTIYLLSNVDKAIKIEPNVLEESSKSRLKKRLPLQAIYSYRKGVVESSPKLKRETIKLDKEIKANINIYPNKASFLTYNETKPMGVLVESLEIVGALRQLFETAWDALKSKK